MTGRNTPPDLAVEISNIKRRLDAIERKLNGLDDVFKPEIVFSYSGPLAVSISPTWTRRETGRMVEVHARLRVAGSTDTLIDIVKNGATILTVTILAGSLSVRRPCNGNDFLFYADQDVLYDEITTVGSGAEDLTLMHRFKR